MPNQIVKIPSQTATVSRFRDMQTLVNHVQSAEPNGMKGIASSNGKIPATWMRPRSYASEPTAWNLRALRCLTQIDAILCGISKQKDAAPDDASVADYDMIAQRGIDTDKALFADYNPTRDHDISGDEAVIADARMMADMIVAPKNYIIAYRREWLDHVTFEDEAVVPDARIVEEGISSADEAREPIAHRFRREIFFLAQRVELGIADRDEHAVRVRWIDFSNLLKGDNR
jgi:hypothetical protein